MFIYLSIYNICLFTKEIQQQRHTRAERFAERRLNEDVDELVREGHWRAHEWFCVFSHVMRFFVCKLLRLLTCAHNASTLTYNFKDKDNDGIAEYIVQCYIELKNFADGIDFILCELLELQTSPHGNCLKCG